MFASARARRPAVHCPVVAMDGPRAAAFANRQHWNQHATLVRAEDHPWLRRQAALGLHGAMAHIVPVGGDDAAPYRAPAVHAAAGLAPLNADRKRHATPPQSNASKQPHLLDPGIGSSRRVGATPSPAGRSPGSRSPAPRSPAVHLPAANSALHFRSALSAPRGTAHIATPGLFDAASPRPQQQLARSSPRNRQSVLWGNNHRLVWKEEHAIASGHFGSVYLAQELGPVTTSTASASTDDTIIAEHCIKVIRFKNYRNIRPTPEGPELETLRRELYDDAAKECVSFVCVPDAPELRSGGICSPPGSTRLHRRRWPGLKTPGSPETRPCPSTPTHTQLSS